jgi:hypothetical protein
MTADRKRKKRARAEGGKYTAARRALEEARAASDAQPVTDGDRAAAQALTDYLLATEIAAAHCVAVDLDGQANATASFSRLPLRACRGGSAKTVTPMSLGSGADGRITFGPAPAATRDSTVTVPVPFLAFGMGIMLPHPLLTGFQAPGFEEASPIAARPPVT